jgi:GNAT superfamily N-acetyltransferase
MREAAEWLIARGDKLWDLSELSDDEAIARAVTRELVIGLDGGGAVAASMYLWREDRQAWPGSKPGEALYVHKLAVRREEAGRGWSERLLFWAGDEARRLKRPFLRLDSELRPRVITLYEKAGFVRIDREPFLLGPHAIVRFERKV